MPPMPYLLLADGWQQAPDMAFWLGLLVVAVFFVLLSVFCSAGSDWSEDL